MGTTKSRLTTLIAGACLSLPLVAQDSGALINALIRKGVLTANEAEDIRADLMRESNTIPAKALGGGRNTDRISVGMRLQHQYANIGTEIRGAAVQPVYTDHPFMRRMYLTLKAGVGGDWGATFTYDFAAGYYDDGFIEWRPTNDHTFNFGLRKVAVGYEERATSGNLKSIERSGVTRYFVEGNNGRRLGAASYRVGAFLDAKMEINPTTNLIYTAAITDPERSDAFADASASGDNTTNHVAFWGTLGLAGRWPEIPGSLWAAGVGAGFMPDRGGPANTNFGRGFDLSIYSVYFDLQMGRYGLMMEYLSADVERGVSLTRDAKPSGWFIQPSLLLTDTIEAVARYQELDTDRRGLNLGDVARSAPSGGTMNKFDEWYAGVNLYLRSNDLKFQLGGFRAKTKETVTGAPAQAKALGVRAQTQLQF
jgi:phosphate-selective porin